MMVIGIVFVLICNSDQNLSLFITKLFAIGCHYIVHYNLHTCKKKLSEIDYTSNVKIRKSIVVILNEKRFML